MTAVLKGTLDGLFLAAVGVVGADWWAGRPTGWIAVALASLPVLRRFGKALRP